MNALLIFLLGIGLLAFLSLVYSALSRRRVERRLNSVLESSPIPTFVIGTDHKVVYWNRALEGLTGIRAEDVIGTKEHWRPFYKTERPCMADLVMNESLGAVPHWYSGKYEKSKGREKIGMTTDFFPDMGEGGRWIRFTASVIRDSRGRIDGAIEVLEDVTEQKLAEQDLIKLKKLESLATFAGGVAQDFDSLISSILRDIFLAKLSMPEEDEMLEKALTAAEKASLLAKELSFKLVTFAKGGYPLRRTEALVPVLRDAIQNIPAGSNIECRTFIPEDLWHARIDSGQIRQVFESIIMNALEAMPEGGTVEFRAENTVLREEDYADIKPGRYVKVSVKDTGSGIAKDDMTRIFDPYFTTKSKSEKKGLGAGLGLSVCYSILKNHEGFISVESEAGSGSTFHVFLPSSEKDGE
jgi:PAS domain S-box-containing protein